MSTDARDAQDAKDEPVKDKLKHPFSTLRSKFENTSLHESLSHKKHSIGKFANLINPNHRHDEEHEKETDDKRSRIADSHRYGSFAPERPGNNVKWYVDGRDYFWAVAEALERATETIYISDWWLSPELFLKRPPAANAKWRLDQVLKRRLEAGVKCYIVVYREVEAHHEKFIVIDYNLAFIGGLDLCFGRWDMQHHPLADVHPEGVAEELWPGQDFNNNRVMDFQKVQDWKANELSKAEYGRMPWHDVAMAVVGDCVYDIAEHFVLRWNFCKRDKYKRDGRFDWLVLEGREADEDLISVQRPKFPVGDYIKHPLSPLATKQLGDKHGSVHAQIVRSSGDWSSGILTEHSIQNAYKELITQAQHYVYIENQFFITATGDQQAPIKNTIGRAMVDAVLRAAKEGRKFRILIVIPAVPGFAGDLREDAALGTRAIMDYQYKSICRGEHSIFEQIKREGVDPRKYIFLFNLRSYDRLNVTPAVKKQEEVSGVKYQDVQRAQAEEIMGEGIHGSKDEDEGTDKHMNYKHAEKERQEALGAKEAWERSAEEAGVTSEKRTTESVAKSAMHDQPSLVDEEWTGEMKEEVDNWIQEELYIHGKVMIVDDKTVICGSSNLNDRSQLGIHDSELSIVMTDTRTLPSKMDGKSYDAGWHAATLRRYLWREHLGLLPPQEVDGSKDPNAQPPDVPNDPHEGETYEFVADPLSDELWEMWTNRATTNTQIFRQLFHADPDDYVKTFEDYDRFLPPKGVKSGHIYDRMVPPQEIRQKLDKVQGHLVWMPLEFLRDADMAERGLQVNALTESVYT